MRKLYASRLVLPFLLLCVVFASCSKEDEVAPGTSMEFTVVDELGNAVEGATVNLYESEESFIEDNQDAKVATGVSDKSGKVLLKDLEPKIYFFSVSHGTSKILTNWEGGTSTQNSIEEDKINTINVVIKESILGYIAGNQKSWKLDKVYVGTEDYTHEIQACGMDDLLSFSKNFQYKFSEGSTKCDPSDVQEEIGSFVLNGTTLIVRTDSGEESINILEITKDKLVYNGPDFREDARLILKAVY